MEPRSLSIYVHVMLMVQVFCCCLIMAGTSSNISPPPDTSTAILIRVDQSGKGDFTRIQDAIDSVPSNNSELVFIWVKPGTYREKIVVPADKPFITLSGNQDSNVVITWNDGGETLSHSPTFKILASDFVGRYLTFQNTYGKSGKGVALRVNADRAAFYGCRILSYQDTLLDDFGRHYYKNCYIEGATDFIFGNGASLFERCHLHSISNGNIGAITAQKRELPSENTGFVFLGCKITGIENGGAILGRPWGSYSRVVFALSYMSSVVQSEGWNDWQDPKMQSSVYYGEYKCYGPGADREKRVNWSHSLSNEEASAFLNKNMIGRRSWLRRTPTRFTRGSIILTKPEI